MFYLVLRATAIVGAVGLLGAVPRGAQVLTSARDAQAMREKVTTIAAHGVGASKRARHTTVTENEVNSYLALEFSEDFPAGVIEPSIAILGTGRVSASAMVDLNAVRKASGNTSPLGPRSFLTGHLPVTATGILHAQNGVGRFELQSASVGGVPVPKLFLQEIVSYYSKNLTTPGGIGIDAPFELPARIREIHVERGYAIVVQ